MSLRVFPVAAVPKTLVAFENDWGGGRNHQGNDIYVWNQDKTATLLPGAINTIGGSPVVAVDDGTLTFSEDPVGGHTAWVVTQDGEAFYYAHLERYEGGERTVKAGETIGYVGRTGNACKKSDPMSPDGCSLGQFHCHFGYKPAGKSGQWVNPYSVLKAAQKNTVPGTVVSVVTNGKVLAITGLAAAVVVSAFWYGMHALEPKRLRRRAA